MNEDGDFRLVFAVEDNRAQVVIISSTTETLGKMEIREVWSPIAKFASTPPCDLSLELLDKHDKKLRSGSYLHLSAEELGFIVGAVVRTADETEMGQPWETTIFRSGDLGG